jgi:hypothetical protein
MTTDRTNFVLNIFYPFRILAIQITISTTHDFISNLHHVMSMKIANYDDYHTTPHNSTCEDQASSKTASAIALIYGYLSINFAIQSFQQ